MEHVVDHSFKIEGISLDISAVGSRITPACGCGSVSGHTRLDGHGHLDLVGAEDLGHLLQLGGRETAREELDCLLFPLDVLIRVDAGGVDCAGFRVLVKRPGALVEVGVSLLLPAGVDSHICTWWWKT
jgi:hypothetical protein